MRYDKIILDNFKLMRLRSSGSEGKLPSRVVSLTFKFSRLSHSLRSCFFPAQPIPQSPLLRRQRVATVSTQSFWILLLGGIVLLLIHQVAGRIVRVS
jgi:hypothetical protein